MPFANEIFEYMTKLNDHCITSLIILLLVSHSRGSTLFDISQRLSVLIMIESRIMITLRVQPFIFSDP